MDQLDLNIDNYSIIDLQKFFKFPINSKITISDVELKETTIREQLLSSGHIDKKLKRDLIEFLNKAKQVLIAAKCEKPKQPTTIPKNYRLDESDFPASRVPPSRESELIVRPETQFIYTQDSDFLPGTINPLKTRVISKCLTIDTRFRENYFNSSATNFNIQLPMILENVLSIQLSSIEMPTSYYVISNQYNNNFFTLTVNGVSEIIVIPGGNYTSASLIIYINNQLVTLGGAFQYIVFAVNIASTFGGSGQMMVGINPTKPLNLDINSIELNFQADKLGNDDRYTPLPLKFGWIMGFRNGVYTGNLNYVSEAIVDISGPRYFYLVVEDYNNNNNNGLFYTAFNSSIMNKSVLGRFPLNTSLYSLLLQNNLNVVVLKREYFGPVTIQKLTIQLLDEFGRIVDLNYMDFSFSMLMTIAYDL